LGTHVFWIAFDMPHVDHGEHDGGGEKMIYTGGQTLMNCTREREREGWTTGQDHRQSEGSGWRNAKR